VHTNVVLAITDYKLLRLQITEEALELYFYAKICVLIYSVNFYAKIFVLIYSVNFAVWKRMRKILEKKFPSKSENKTWFTFSPTDITVNNFVLKKIPPKKWPIQKSPLVGKE
jgi:hypothetical protein